MNKMTVYEEMPLNEMGQVLVKSGFFEDAKDASQAIVKVLAGRELGFGPIASMTGIYIVKGKPTLSANLMAAAIKRDPRYNYRVVQLTDEVCELIFLESGEEIGRSIFTKEDATKAGTQNMGKFPRNMLFARALSNGVKWHCPDVMSGAPVYTPDELGAEVDDETGEIIPGSYKVVKPDSKSKPPAVKPTPQSNTPITAAVIAAGLTENTFSFNKTMAKLNLPADASEETVLGAFRVYRAARDADATSDEAAEMANAQLDLQAATEYTTGSGKVLGKLSPDELTSMIEQIDALADPTRKMLEIKRHCLTLIEYAESLEV